MNESVGSRRSFSDFKRPYSHVNFWASPNVSDSAGTNLLLFFAEFCNDGEDKEDQQSICCPVLDLSTNGVVPLHIDISYYTFLKFNLSLTLKLIIFSSSCCYIEAYYLFLFLFFFALEVRCCYCELEGIKIVQPACGSYHGSYCEFEKMALGEHTITNERIISHGKLTACSVGMFGEDYIYFDPARDAKFVQAMNQTAWAENVSWDEFEKLEQLDVY